jgi:hypothetical protein
LASSLRRGLGVLFERWSLVASSVSLFPSSSLGSPVSGRVSALSWCPRTSSVLVTLGGWPPSACRVRGASPDAVSALVALLRAARASGRPVSLRARGGWPAASFFCSVSVESSSEEHQMYCTSGVLEAPSPSLGDRLAAVGWPFKGPVFRSVRA